MISAPNRSRELFFGGTAESRAHSRFLEGQRDSLRTGQEMAQAQTLPENTDDPHTYAERSNSVE